MKLKINRRLLKYKLNTFDYNKINNKAYFTQYRSRLLALYMYYEHGLDYFIKTLVKYSKNKFFDITSRDFPDIDLEIKEKFNLIPDDRIDRLRVLSLKYNIKYCLKCNTRIHDSKMFCSNKCSNSYKSSNPEYIDNLSKAIKKWHSNQTDEFKSLKNEKIRKSVIKTVYSKSSEERKIVYGTNTGDRTSYSNLSNRFSDINFLFDEDFYYNNKFLPVSCKKCNFKWTMTKTTGISRSFCTKCNPLKKHKTQTDIFNFLYIYVDCSQNNKSILDSKELDIVCLNKNFSIEFDGLLPHSFGNCRISYYNNTSINRNYHRDKTEESEKNGLQLFHIFENEWLDKNKREIWKSMLLNKIGISEKIFARKCTIKNVNFKDEHEFLEKNHLQGFTKSSLKYGLYYNDELVSLMTFRKHKKHQWEIARFANKLNTTVIGGASKLLNHFEKLNKPRELLSFANRRWSVGNLYEKLGFTFVSNTEPNYFYFKEGTINLEKREKFQKHLLSNILTEFNSEISEFQNMFNNGYRVIFDCGNKKYIKQYQA